ncbi:MAG: hypothetical protein KGJ13_11595 [Patescibacteria group bacterium]|nr:hypothetical protein [Patescibacteria group bacterium]
MKLVLILAAFLAAITIELWGTERDIRGYFGSPDPESWWAVILGTVTLAAIWFILLICIFV